MNSQNSQQPECPIAQNNQNPQSNIPMETNPEAQINQPIAIIEDTPALWQPVDWGQLAGQLISIGGAPIAYILSLAILCRAIAQLIEAIDGLFDRSSETDEKASD